MASLTDFSTNHDPHLTVAIDCGNNLPNITNSSERIASKDEEIARLRRRVEEENQVTEDQLLVLREEVRMEMMNAGNNGEMDELHARVRSRLI